MLNVNVEFSHEVLANDFDKLAKELLMMQTDYVEDESTMLTISYH